MRERAPLTIALILIMFISLLNPAPESLRELTKEDVIHTSDVTWSGNMTLDDHVTITSSATLTIEAGTKINVTEDVTVTISGNLDIQGTSISPVEIWGSWIAETSVQARWQGFLLESGSSTTVTHTEISDSRGGFDLESGATLDIGSTNFTDNIIGVWNKGTLTGDGFSCFTASTSCLRIDGTTTINQITSSSSSEVVHVNNGGSANIGTVHSTNDADVIVLESGSIFNGEIEADGFSRVVRGSGSVSATVTLDSIGTGNVLVESDSLSGLLVTGGSPCSSTCTVESIITGFVDDVVFSSLFLHCGGLNPCIDARVDGTLEFAGAWPSTEIYPSSLFARLRGDGGVRINQISVHSNTPLFDVSGNGALSVENSTLRGNGGMISGWSIDLSNTIIPADNTGFVLLDVNAQLNSVEIARSFSSSDSTSIGIRAVWSNLQMDNVAMIGWNEGIVCESECNLIGSTISSGDGGRNSGSGITVDGGSAQIASLETSASDVGINLIDGTIHVANWTVDMAHRSYGIQLANDANAIVREMPGYTSSGAHDGFGDGTLLWGSSGNPTLAVSVEEQFEESVIQVEDLVGNPISGASAHAHGFNEISNSSGEVILPLLPSGSFVEIEDPASGMGSSADMFPPGGSIQIAVVPGSGDWTIPTGVNARLVNGDFVLNGNLTIESTASLMLIDSTLTIPESSTLTIESNGLLKGDNGTLSGGTASLTAGVPFRGEGAGLLVTSQITFTCYDPWTWVKTSLTGDLSLSMDCELILDGGHASGAISLSQDSILRERSHLTVRVQDSGMLVEGANVSVGGSVVQTDGTGTASFSSNWRTVDGSGETVAGSKTVIVQHANINRYRSWNPSTSELIDVMISTINIGSTVEDIRLEPIFSPYHLGGNLAVTSGTSLEIMSGVELTLAEGVQIAIEGEMNTNDAWLGGLGSHGLKIHNNGQLTMNDGFYSGGPLIVESGGNAHLTEISISDAPLSVISTTNPTFLAIHDSIIQQSDICVRAQGASANLIIQSTEIQNCGMIGIWSTSAHLNLSDTTLGQGNAKGAWIQSSYGEVIHLNASMHNGDGAALDLDMQDSSLSISHLELASGGATSALQIEYSEGAHIRDSIIHGSPGAQIENSAIILERVDFIGADTGSAIAIFGAKSSNPVHIIDCEIEDYAIAIHLEGDIGDLESQPVLIEQSHLHATTAIEANTLQFMVNGGEIDGVIELIAMDKAWSATAVNVDVNTVSISGDARLYEGFDWTINMIDEQGNPLVSSVTFEIEVSEFDPLLGIQDLSFVDPDIIQILSRVHTESGTMDVQFANWSIASSNYLPQSGQLVLSTSGQRVLTIVVAPNMNPVITIIHPLEGSEINAGNTLHFNATATDPDGDEIVLWNWYLIGNDFERLIGESSSGEFYATEQGEWLLRLVVVDENGGESQASVLFTINPMDNDNDFIDSCQTQGSNAWFDPVTGHLCGPDLFDEDDDNDGIRDDRDDFPYDACAHKDTDGDALPDSILSNCETDFVADDDDDNDGIPDSEDSHPTDPNIGSESAEKSLAATVCSPGVVLTVGVLIVFTVFAILRYRGSDKTSFGRQED
ncbi:MAG: hypothetical protein VYA86_01590 [Candidatus Thermoplasmatota archaeon]|nr:hypothetical protein [Candidatus Thermoplasmatota archaeon]